MFFTKNNKEIENLKKEIDALKINLRKSTLIESYSNLYTIRPNTETLKEAIDGLRNEIYFKEYTIVGCNKISLKQKLEREIKEKNREINNLKQELKKIKEIVREVTDYVYKEPK